MKTTGIRNSDHYTSPDYPRYMDDTDLQLLYEAQRQSDECRNPDHKTVLIPEDADCPRCATCGKKVYL